MASSSSAKAMRDTTLLAGAWALASVLAASLRVVGGASPGAWCFAWAYAGWLPLAPLIAWRMSRLPRGRIGRLRAHLLLAAVAFAGHWVVFGCLGVIVRGAWPGIDSWFARALVPLHLAMYVSLVWAASAIREVHRAQEEERELSEGEREVEAARLALAHSRVDASGLLRSLGRARRLLEERPSQGGRAVHALAELLRSCLDAIAEERPWSVADDLRIIERYAAFESSVRPAPVVVGHSVPHDRLPDPIERLSLFRRVAAGVEARIAGEPVFVRLLVRGADLDVEVSGGSGRASGAAV